MVHIAELVLDCACREQTLHWAIFQQLKSPSPGFEEVIKAHFRLQKDAIEQQVRLAVDTSVVRGHKSCSAHATPLSGKSTPMALSASLTVHPTLLQCDMWIREADGAAAKRMRVHLNSWLALLSKL